MMPPINSPGLAGVASRVVGRGNPAQGVAPRGPLAPSMPLEGPAPMMSPMQGTTVAGMGVPAGPMPSGGGGAPNFSSIMNIPGMSPHEVCHTDEGAADTVERYPVGTGSWQSRSHSGEVSHEDDTLRPQGPAAPCDYACDMGTCAPHAGNYPQDAGKMES